VGEWPFGKQINALRPNRSALPLLFAAVCGRGLEPHGTSPQEPNLPVLAKPPVRGLRQGTAQWLRPELRVRVKHLKGKGALRHTTVKQLIMD
jgi:hypothetical protein